MSREHKPINNLKFQRDKYPDVLEVVNRLAELEHRKPHDSARRLIVDCGRDRIRHLCESQSARHAG